MPWSHRLFVASSVIEREGGIGRPFLCDIFEKVTLHSLKATPHKIAIFANKIIYTIVESEASHSTDFESRAFGFICHRRRWYGSNIDCPLSYQHIATYGGPILLSIRRRRCRCQVLPHHRTTSSSPQLHIDIYVHLGRHHRHRQSNCDWEII